MELKHPFVFQVDSDEISNAYKYHPNYLIEYNKQYSEQLKLCVIYFSSHDIYYPNNALALQNQLLLKNKFEWYNNRIEADKHIFLRDIKKQWYLTGINSELNSIESVLDFLIKETAGYKIQTIGSSAGGYAAVLFGQLLGAEKIYTFNGQFMVSDLLFSSNENINPIVFRNVSNPDVNKYFSLKPYIKNPYTILYFYSNKSNWDSIQREHVKDLEINFIPFNTSHHGIPFPKIAMKKVLKLEINEINNYKKINNPIIFSIKQVGFKSTFWFITTEIMRKIRKQLVQLFKINNFGK